MKFLNIISKIPKNPTLPTTTTQTNVPVWKTVMKDVAIGGFTSFLGIGSLSLLNYGIANHDFTTILGSFGASAVLLFGAPSAPFSQPRNLFGGHILSCIIGVACHELISVPMNSPWLAAPVSVSLSLMTMIATKTVHPPAGGTALIAVLGSEQLHDMQFKLLIPTISSASLLFGVAMLNNIFKRKYPHKWF